MANLHQGPHDIDKPENPADSPSRIQSGKSSSNAAAAETVRSLFENGKHDFILSRAQEHFLAGDVVGGLKAVDRYAADSNLDPDKTQQLHAQAFPILKACAQRLLENDDFEAVRKALEYLPRLAAASK
jgi:hypothetical protein